jgi:hypothetical protein
MICRNDAAMLGRIQRRPCRDAARILSAAP